MKIVGSFFPNLWTLYIVSDGKIGDKVFCGRGVGVLYWDNYLLVGPKEGLHMQNWDSTGSGGFRKKNHRWGS